MTQITLIAVGTFPRLRICHAQGPSPALRIWGIAQNPPSPPPEPPLEFRTAAELLPKPGKSIIHLWIKLWAACRALVQHIVKLLLWQKKNEETCAVSSSHTHASLQALFSLNTNCIPQLAHCSPLQKCSHLRNTSLMADGALCNSH